MLQLGNVVQTSLAYVSTRKEQTMILPCSCVHKAQDRLHGSGKRVCNALKSTGPGDEKYRCTVCKTEKTRQDNPKPVRV